MSENEEIRCPICCDPVPPKGKTGPRKKYCTERCKRLANKPSPDAYKRQKERQLRLSAEIRASTVKTCPVCDATFTPEKSLAKMYCSHQCYRKATKYSKSRTCTESDCDLPVATRDLCNVHSRRENRVTGQEKPKQWDEKSKANYRLRLERLGGARNSDPAMLKKLIARGDKDCPECGEEIDLTLEYPHPMYRTIDHKKPLAKGGKHTLSNCQLMHAQCNASKGVRLSEKA